MNQENKKPNSCIYIYMSFVYIYVIRIFISSTFKEDEGKGYKIGQCQNELTPSRESNPGANKASRAIGDLLN